MRIRTAIAVAASMALIGTAAIAKGPGAMISKRPSSEPGQQVHTARWTNKAPTIDGVIEPGEYAGAIPLRLDFKHRDSAPGLIPAWIADINGPQDLSARVLILYNATDIYVAFDVTDDEVWTDTPGRIYDDHTEIYFDGDQVGEDYDQCSNSPDPSFPFCPDSEGFQLVVDAAGEMLQYNVDPVDWSAAASRTPQGYSTEFRVSLSSIDTQDGPGSAPPTPGSTVGFNILIIDDDDGGDKLKGPADSGGAWDGDAETWLWRREADWGSLYLAPPTGRAKPAGDVSSWGDVKKGVGDR